MSSWFVVTVGSLSFRVFIKNVVCLCGYFRLPCLLSLFGFFLPFLPSFLASAWLLPCSGEDKAVDHLVFVVHGVELETDLGFKRLVDCGKFAERL